MSLLPVKSGSFSTALFACIIIYLDWIQSYKSTRPNNGGLPQSYTCSHLMLGLAVSHNLKNSHRIATTRSNLNCFVSCFLFLDSVPLPLRLAFVSFSSRPGSVPDLFPTRSNSRSRLIIVSFSSHHSLVPVPVPILSRLGTHFDLAPSRFSHAWMDQISIIFHYFIIHCRYRTQSLQKCAFLLLRKEPRFHPSANTSAPRRVNHL